MLISDAVHVPVETGGASHDAQSFCLSYRNQQRDPLVLKCLEFSLTL